MICAKCRRVMKLVTTGMIVRFLKDRSQDETYQRGDEHKCPECGNSVICDFGEAYHEKSPYDEEGKPKFSIAVLG